MLHRLVAMLIIGFWLAMTGLLIVRELYPEATQLNSVPVSYVGRLMFQHQQPSSLKVYDGSDEAGYINIEPKLHPTSGARILDVNGNLAVRPLGGNEQRISWHGRIDLDTAYSLQRIRVNLSTQDGGQLAVDVDAAAGTAAFNTGSNAHGRGSATITLDEKGLAKLLSLAGLDSGILRQLHGKPAEMPPAEYGAQQSSTRLSGETLSTYLFSMKVGGQTIFEAHISQLGQVLRAHVPLLGYRLLPDNVAP
jgi:hypothetical protein